MCIVYPKTIQPNHERRHSFNHPPFLGRLHMKEEKNSGLLMHAIGHILIKKRCINTWRHVKASLINRKATQ